MLNKIVAATDFSTRSQRALRRAGQLARHANAALSLVHVVDDDQPPSLVELEIRESEKFLNEQIGVLGELRDVRCRAVVTTGEAFDGILRVAEEQSADLIVMGSHRKQLLRDIFVGTTIERVIRTGPFPVLMVNTDSDHSYRYVIAGADTSEPSAHAIRTAKTLGLIDDTNLTVVHAFTAPGRGKLYVANAPKDQIDDYVAGEQRQAHMELSVFFAAHDLRGAHWSYHIEEGNAFEVISRLASERRPDLVVIGTHGRSGLVKMLIGSVAEQILRSLDIDILAVPPSR